MQNCRKLKILTIANSASPHAQRPVRSLLDAGHSVLLFDYKEKDPFQGENFEGRYIHVPDPSGGMFADKKDFKNVECILNKIFKVFSPDIIHIHWISWHLSICAKLHFCPLVVSVWGSDLNTAITENPLGVYSWCDDLFRPARTLQLADHIIVDDITMIAKCAFAAPGIPTSLYPLGVDEAFFVPSMEHTDKIRHLLHIGNEMIFTVPRLLAPLYRPDMILQAFALAARGTDTILVFKKFFSPDMAVIRRLRHLAHLLGVEAQVRFCPALSLTDLRDLYAASAALLNFPVRDAFPVTFAEAAACGAPVITHFLPAYDVPLVTECFDVLPEASVECMAAAIQRRMERAPDESILRRARELARRDYSHASYVRGVLSVYNTLIETKAGM